MALVTVSNPTTFTAFAGVVTVANGSQHSIRSQFGTLTQNYFGNGFTYAGTSVTGGTVTSISLVDGGITYYTITGLSAHAPTVANYVTSGDSLGLSNFLLGGADTLDASTGQLSYDPDGNATAFAATPFAILASHPVVSAEDFNVI